MIKKNISKYIFYAVVIDTLFLPYFWLISVPLSLPLIFYWAFKNFSIIKNSKYYQLSLMLVISMVFGGFMGAFRDSALIYDNIKLTLSFTYIIICSIFFDDLLKKHEIRLDKIFFLFFLFVLFIGSLYLFDKQVYLSAVQIWNSRSGGTFASIYEYLEGYRFAFIWTDPNNIAYMISTIYFFSLIYFNFGYSKNLLLLAIVLLTLIISMSRGGILAFSITTILFLIISFGRIKKFDTKTKNKNYNISKFLIFCTLLSLIIFIYGDIFNSIVNSEIIQESLERLSSDDDTRLNAWQSYISTLAEGQFLLNIFTGYGAGSIIGEKSISPHNGHILWILNYGLISYIAFLFFFFRINLSSGIKYYIWCLPFFIGFTLNVMIGELKLTVTYLLMLSYSNALINARKINSSFNDKRFF